MGLVLHFFTNMLYTTALTATIYAVYTNIVRITDLLDMVHEEVPHHRFLMDTIHDHLMQQLLIMKLEERVFAGLDAGAKEKLSEVSTLLGAETNGDTNLSLDGLDPQVSELTDAQRAA